MCLYAYRSIHTNYILSLYSIYGFPDGATGKKPTCEYRRHETWVQSLGQEDPLEEEMRTHSSILAWRIPRTEEPGGLQSMALQSHKIEAT